MARKPRKTDTPAEIGDNDLTPEEQERAWLLFYYQKAKDQALLVDRAAAAKKAASDALTDIFRSAKADAKLSRQELAGYLADGKLGQKTLSAAEERRVRHKAWLGQPVGSQLDMFAGMPVEVQDEAHAKGVGYETGLRGDACEMPETLQPRFAQAFAAGWGKGQEELSWALSAVGKIIDRRPDANANPVDLEPEPEDDPQAGIDEAARELKAKGWTDPAPAEAELADA